MRRSLLPFILLLLAAGAPLAPGLARAQGGAAASVNGEAITARDIEQRMRISSALFRRPLTRQAALQELIDDKVKVLEGRRIGMRVTEAHQAEMMNRFASSNRMTAIDFERSLVRAGIDPEALRAKIAADAVWGELLRVRARSSSVSNAELDAEVQRRAAAGGATIIDYVLRPIVFVVPAGTSPAQRERDAAALRARFTDCESGVELARSMRDVAVRERVTRSSPELTQATRDLLARTPVGRLTPAFRTEQGVEVLAVCERSERRDLGRLRNEVEQEILLRRSQGTAEAYLRELRAKFEIRR